MEQSVPSREPQPVAGNAALRRRMLDAGHQLIEAAGGLAVSMDAISMDRVIKEAEVSRSSAYREWHTKEAFQMDLLCDVAGPSWQGTAAFSPKTISLVKDLVAEHLGDLTSASGRRRVLAEAIRVGAEQNFRDVVASTEWRSYVALTATMLSLQEEDRTRVSVALQAAESRFLNRMSDFYADVTLILGLRLKAEIPDFQTLAALGAALVEGLALRSFLVPDVVSNPVSTPDEGPDWHLAAVGFAGVFDALVETISDEEYDFSAALTEYLKRQAAREEEESG